jgi:hypothetical protein
MITLAALCMVAGLFRPAAMAQNDPRASNARTDDSDQADDTRETVARVSFASGDASFLRGDDQDDWQDVDVNVPMSTGDRVYTGDEGRLELQTGGNVLRLDARTDLTALDLTDEMKQFSLDTGTASFQVRGLADDETFEVDTPNAAVTFERAGEYRIDVDEDGYTSVGVVRGRATVASGGGEVVLDAGEQMDIQGLDDPRYDIVAMAQRDAFDDWVTGREQRLTRSRSYEYVSHDIPGCEDLDDYGRWSVISEYGNVWTPSAVAVGWSPYSDGHWIWQDPWGWTWVAAEPWGWAPYHYGRWVNSGARWYWVPVSRTVVRVRYAPALVAFVGGGPGWSVTMGSSGGGYVGWFPLAPSDPLLPWWGSRARIENRTTTNITYVNRVHVTVVNQNTFVSGGFVRTNIVREPAVVRDVSRGPIVTGAIPLTPTRGALRVASRAEPARMVRSRPERAARAVVVRTTPPPAPISFDRKTTIIRENRGAPVTAAAEARAAAASPQAARPQIAVKPVTPEPGVVKLAPRNQGADTKQPRPVQQGRGRGRGQGDRGAPDAAAPQQAMPEPRATPEQRTPPQRTPPPPRTQPEPQSPPPAEQGAAPDRTAPPPRALPPGQERRETTGAPPPPERPNATRPQPPANDAGGGQRSARDKVKADKEKAKGRNKPDKADKPDKKDEKN